MNIFKHELIMKKQSILIWSLSLSAFMIFYMAFFPALAKDAASFDSIMNSFPEEMLQALGIKEGLSIASLIGYFTLTFGMIQLAIAIQSANYGFSILSEEERELTADFLLSKPVSRSTIYFSKFSAAFLSLFVSAIAVGISSLIALRLFNGGESYRLAHVLKLILTVPVFQLLFMSIGMFISLLFKKIRSVLSLSMGLAIGLYVINSVRGIIDSDLLGYISPYYYFEPGVILIDGIYDLKLFGLAIGIIIISLVGSYLLYNRRDIHSL
ncbi:ABC-2 type transport system permease protein [Halolactibacillus halophilus]|uniref:ABC transporter permease n=1 Tax=Halolactibacillus halophilus TaxID=306540 RepID=A0A1I5T5H6_9BACI|nr:ABC transporter permease subunit [Halolactibacillus halophilus]GEM02929.1 ABC transporter permease [Halolactibacillus halophilus]SFP78208.1 ABC-2 type transport system permease protein [Halolactibacillus halophilus]